jgi:predicted O-methyltransferase YrrM
VQSDEEKMDNQKGKEILNQLEEIKKQNEFIVHQIMNNDQQIINFVLTQTQTLYRQMEALFSLYSTFQIRFPLPQMRGWPISPDFANILVSYILESKPKIILELGSGISTILCSYALEKNGMGKIISIDHDNSFLSKSQNQLAQHQLSQYAKFIHAPLTEVKIQNETWNWYDLKDLSLDNPIDLLIVDGPPSTVQKEARYPAVPLLRKYFTDQTAIFLDDAGRPDEANTVKRWLNEMPDFHVESPETEKGIAILKKA